MFISVYVALANETGYSSVYKFYLLVILKHFGFEDLRGLFQPMIL